MTCPCHFLTGQNSAVQKGAVKLHPILDHDGYLPSFAVITEGNVSDVKVAHQLSFDPGTIVVDDTCHESIE